MDGNHFSHSLGVSELEELRRVLSPERIRSYQRASEGDVGAAVQLHTWNTMISGAFYGPLQAVELALRNAVHECLSAVHGRRWFESGRILARNELRRVEEAQSQVTRKQKKPTPDRVVAELSFGFWVALFAKRYDVLWNADLHRVFTPTPPRRDLQDELAQLRRLRNLIAHHESIHHLPLGKRHEGLLWVLELISPVAAEWVGHCSRVPEILSKPHKMTDRF